MIIDFHTHTFPDHIAERAVQKLRRSSHIRAYSDGTAEGLRRHAAEAGIGLSVIQPVATSPEQVEHINTRVMQRNREEKERANRPENNVLPEEKQSRLLSFGCMHPAYACYREELRRLAAAGVPGIKLHAYFQGCDMDDIRYLRILDAAAENGLIVLAHAGYDQGFPGEHCCTVPMLHRIMREVSGITMVAAHMGGWNEWDQVPELLADTGIYLDTSVSTGTQLLDPQAFAAIVQAFPEGHILFATDSPWSDPGKSIDFIQQTSLSDHTKEEILGGAAARLLKAQKKGLS